MSTAKRHIWWATVVASAGISAAALTGCGSGDGGETDDLSGPAPVRLSSVDLQSRWWEWAAAEPTDSNPVADPTGRDCARNQPKDRWFLAGTFGGHTSRTCTIPADRPIAFPVVNIVGELMDCGGFDRSAEGTVEVDGEKVAVDRHEGVEFRYFAAEGNPVTEEEGIFQGAGCGLWAQLPPLSPGRHTVEIRGGAEDLTVSVDYDLTVEGKPGAARGA
ncbi:signal protein [Streptomyces sp. NBC_01506]|uniref:signal protein n=1 Tax=Streptomyces sp. NBC_01506 TaxID=2903887 RepID=UPI00386BF890